MQSLKQLIQTKNPVDKNKYVTREFQDFGYHLAEALGDMAHKSLYIKMAKSTDRSILQQALSFVSDSNANNKGALFMWKVKQICLLKK